MRRAVPAVLSIAGSDSGGGAGIQADLKAFARCGVHGMTAITALTAQNTVGVSGRPRRSRPAFIVEQVRAVAEDIGVDAVKIGMLGTAATVEAVDEALDLLDPGTPIVIDPVMVAESGAVLLDDAARAALVERLLPRATVDHAQPPGGARARPATTRPTDPRRSPARCTRSGPDVVVVTGGHRDEATDVVLRRRADVIEIPGERYPDGAAHGSGCTHSSVLAAQLALGDDPLAAARRRARASRPRRSATACASSAPGAGPVDVLGGAPDAAPALSAAPGLEYHRGDEVPPDAAGLRRAADRRGRRRGRRGRAAAGRGVPPPAGRRACGPRSRPRVATAGARREMVRAFEEIPRDADRVIFFPRAAGGGGA